MLPPPWTWEATSTHANASVAVTKPFPSAVVVAVALTAAHSSSLLTAVAEGARCWSRLRHHAAVVVAAAVLPHPQSLPSLLPSYATGSLMQVLLSLCQHDTARLTRCRCFEQWAACSQPPAGPHAATAAWLAAVFCVRHHRLQVHRRGRVRSRALERAAPASVAAAAACATPPRTHRACLRVCILLAASGAGRGAEKVPKSKVALRRSFRFPACGVRA